MKNIALLFFGILFTIGFSYSGLILSSQLQFGSLRQTTAELDEDGNQIQGDPLFPRRESGLALQGKQVYTDLGCIYCHTQQIRRDGYGADIDRGWGLRATVARDYIMQDRVLLGTMRTGPDLAHVGGRITGEEGRQWHHQHLYNPRITSEGSIMPSFSFLYEVREIDGAPSADAVKIPADSPYSPEPGFEVVPTRRATALVEYLLSLKVDYSLPEAPITKK